MLQRRKLLTKTTKQSSVF